MFFRLYLAICLIFFWNMLIWVPTPQFCGKLKIHFSDISNIFLERITYKDYPNECDRYHFTDQWPDLSQFLQSTCLPLVKTCPMLWNANGDVEEYHFSPFATQFCHNIVQFRPFFLTS